MRITVLASKKDEAGRNIAKALQQDVMLIEQDSIFFDECDKLDTDIIIFATRHQSKKGVPSLCAHAVGNWGVAELGGKEKNLGVAPALYLKRAIQLLEEKNALGWNVFQEATHHGPYSSKPILFLEIGSSLAEYQNTTAAALLADVIRDLCAYKLHHCMTAVGIGGLHHTPNFKKIQLQTDIAIGHVCPKYNLQFLSKEMLVQAIEKTQPKAELIILDWKGLGDEKERIKKLVDEVSAERGVKVMRT